MPSKLAEVLKPNGVDFLAESLGRGAGAPRERLADDHWFVENVADFAWLAAAASPRVPGRRGPDLNTFLLQVRRGTNGREGGGKRTAARPGRGRQWREGEQGKPENPQGDGGKKVPPKSHLSVVPKKPAPRPRAKTGAGPPRRLSPPRLFRRAAT